MEMFEQKNIGRAVFSPDSKEVEITPNGYLLRNKKPVYLLRVGQETGGFIFDTVNGMSTFQPITMNKNIVPYSATISLDINRPAFHYLKTESNDTTINAISAGKPGQKITLLIKNDSTANRTITFGTYFVSSGTIIGSTAASSITTFESDGNNWYETGRTTALA